jgi:hypothetical protein
MKQPKLGQADRGLFVSRPARGSGFWWSPALCSLLDATIEMSHSSATTLAVPMASSSMRIAELREARVTGMQPIGEFMARRFTRSREVRRSRAASA